MKPGRGPDSRWNVGILVFDGVEVLDFAGPFEVFSRTRTEPGIESRRADASAPYAVFTVARSHQAVEATGGLGVLPSHDFEDHPPIDLNHIDMPVTYLAGKWDSITSAKSMRTASMQTPHSRYVELAATHFVPLQFPKRMSTELRRLVERCQL